MKKLLAILLILSSCEPAWTEIVNINPHSISLFQYRQSKKYKSELMVGTLALMVGGVFQGMVSRERDDAQYADHYLLATYDDENPIYNDPHKDDIQSHYLGELNKHRERQGIYEGVSYTLFGVGTILIAKGLWDLHIYRRDWVQHVSISYQERDFAMIRYEQKF